MGNEYQLSGFVRDFRAAASAVAGDAELTERLKPLVLRLAGATSWRRPSHYECDAEQGFGIHALHEDPDHGLWVVAVSWLPHRGPPPHNHGTWAVIAGIDGEEKNILWLRRAGRLEHQAEEIIGPGQVTAFLPHAIHSVLNESDRVTLSLHVYGKNLNYAERSQFDPERGTEKAYKVKVHA